MNKIWNITKNGIVEYVCSVTFRSLDEARQHIERMNESNPGTAFYIHQMDTTSDYLNNFDYENAFNKIESK